MKRRQFIVALIGSTFWARGARAQQAANVRRIGLLSPFSPANTLRWDTALLRGLRDLGWIEGRNLAIERRYAEGKLERLPDLAGDLVRQKVELIVSTVTADTQAAKNAATDIPVVMVAAGDPVATGLVTSLARPGGHVTGLSQMTPDLSGKRLELLKEIVPNVSAVALLFNPEDPLSVLDRQEAERSAQALGIKTHSRSVRNAADLDSALHEVLASRAEALVLMPAPVMIENLKPIADFARQNHLPSTFHLREFADAGGLVSYGVDRADLFRRAASYVDKILKGAKPGRFADRAADEIRTGDQFEDGEGARPRHSPARALHRRRGYRMGQPPRDMLRCCREHEPKRIAAASRVRCTHRRRFVPADEQ